MRVKYIKRTMYKLLLILFLLISFNLKSQKVLCHPMSSEEECLLVYKSLNEFIEDTNVTVIYNGLSPLHPLFEGITWGYNKHLYVINLNLITLSGSDRRWTILHEVGHVIDLYNRDLTMHPLTWKGEPVKEDLPWSERPWEINADQWAFRLWHRLLDDPIPYYIEMDMIKQFEEKPSCIKQ